MKSGSQARQKSQPAITPTDDPQVAELDRRLLAVAGSQVIRLQPETRVADLLARGRAFDLPVVTKRGEPHECHMNAAAMWAKDIAKNTLVSGYGCVGGAWLAHSWVVGGGRLHETTVRFERYFGYPLAELEALAFWLTNYLPNRYPGPMALLPDLLQRAAEGRSDSPAQMCPVTESGT